MIDTKKINVLYIDDEEYNLKSFSANYRTDFNVFTAKDINSAENILYNNPIHILVSDQRMPEITGIDLIKRFKKVYPNLVCIIVTGYFDIDKIIQNIHNGILFKYFLKPIPIEELKQTIIGGFNYYQIRSAFENQSSYFRYVFENSNDAVMYIDKHGNIQEMNMYCLNMFKIDRKDLSRKVVKALFYNLTEYKKTLRFLIKNKSCYDFPIIIKDEHNNKINALLSAIPVLESNVILGYRCLIRDITQQQKLDELIARIFIETQENERLRFSDNLHDSIGQKLSGVRLLVQALRNKSINDNNKKDFELILNSLSQTIIELRHICFNIMPKTLEIMGLNEALNEIVNQIGAGNGVKIKVKFDKRIPRFTNDYELTIFRILQEFLNKSLKHSGASEIIISIKLFSSHLHIELTDNGCGFDLTAFSAKKGFGIQGIISRVHAYNGKIDINSKAKSGTQYIIEIPFEGKQSNNNFTQ